MHYLLGSSCLLFSMSIHPYIVYTLTAQSTYVLFDPLHLSFVEKFQYHVAQGIWYASLLISTDDMISKYIYEKSPTGIVQHILIYNMFGRT